MWLERNTTNHYAFRERIYSALAVAAISLTLVEICILSLQYYTHMLSGLKKTLYTSRIACKVEIMQKFELCQTKTCPRFKWICKMWLCSTPHHGTSLSSRCSVCVESPCNSATAASQETHQMAQLEGLQQLPWTSIKPQIPSSSTASAHLESAKLQKMELDLDTELKDDKNKWGLGTEPGLSSNLTFPHNYCIVV